MALTRKHAMVQAAIILLLCSVLLAGCTAPQSSPHRTPPPLLTPGAAPVEPSDAPGTPVTPTATTTAAPTTPAVAAGTITAELPYGVTISYPADWALEETGVPVSRDYGRDVLSIANLYSPKIPFERTLTGPNPDPSDRTILTIDVDDSGVTDPEAYFNRATIAFQDEYGSIDITRHDFQLRIAGYKSYRMEFDAKERRETCLFTKAGERMYIFTFANPTPYSSEVEEMIRSIRIAP